MKAKCDESKLPKWALRRLSEARSLAQGSMTFEATHPCLLKKGTKIKFTVPVTYDLALSVGDTITFDVQVNIEDQFRGVLRRSTLPDY